jgi:hypothetical protein
MAIARRDPSVELVSVDSTQVYRGIDVGTAQPTSAERAGCRTTCSTPPTRRRTSRSTTSRRPSARRWPASRPRERALDQPRITRYQVRSTVPEPTVGEDLALVSPGSGVRPTGRCPVQPLAADTSSRHPHAAERLGADDRAGSIGSSCDGGTRRAHRPSGRELRRGDDDASISLRLSSSGRLLSSATDHSLQIWDVGTGQQLGLGVRRRRIVRRIGLRAGGGADRNAPTTPLEGGSLEPAGEAVGV